MGLRLSQLFSELIQDNKVGDKNGENLQSIARISERLPFLASGCLEYYLGKEEGRMDLNVCVSKELNEHKLSVDWESLKELIHSNKTQKSFRPIIDFWKKWGNDDFGLLPTIDFVWLVFDISKSNTEGILPWYYIMYQSNPLTNDSRVKNALIKRTKEELNLIEVDYQAFENTFLSFPENVSIRSIGFKPNQSRSIRAYIYTQSMTDLIHLFKICKWPGNTSNFLNEIESFQNLTFKFAIAADFSPSMQPKIGIELYFKEENLERILTLLASKKLCKKETINSLLNWSGEVELDFEEKELNWPSEIVDGIKKPHEKVRIKKNIPLIKLIYEEGKPLTAKIYLYYRPDLSFYVIS
jgi:hypothetical protein